MPATRSFDYAVLRIVPRVERDEFINAGVIVWCPELDFLGARPHDLGEYPRIFDHEYAAMEPATRTRLEWRFDEPNRALAQLLGRELPWAS